MPKSNKTTVLQRIQECVKLLLAGANFDDVCQYASQGAWNVSRRQVHRYVEAAYKRLAKSAERDRNQLLGRHMMQRRVLYARALKANDLRTALLVLRDEAALQGLYPPTKLAATSPNGEQAYHVYVMAELIKLVERSKERPDVIDGVVLDQILLQQGAADDGKANASDASNRS
jgi:hypothetical protein